MKEPDCVCNLEFGFRLHLTGVLVLEGFTEDLSQACCGCGRVCTHDEIWLFSQEVTEVLVLGDCLLHVVGDGQQAQPVGDKASVSCVALNKSGLELDDLTNGSDSVITGVVVHLEFLFLVLDLRGDSEFYSALKGRQAELSARCEGSTSVLGNDSNTVGRGLSKSGTSVAREATDSSDDALEVLRGEVSGSQVLNHVIEDEESELEALLLTAAEAAGNDLVTKACNKSCDVISVSLEKAAHKLSSRNLQIKLVGVLFLDQSHIISIQSIVLVLDLLLRECQVLGNSFERLGDNINGFISKVSDLFGSHKTGTGDINHILEGLNLDDQSVSVEFSLHGLVNVCVENFGHSVKLLNRDVTCLACLH